MERIKFPWDRFAEQWQDNYQELKEYYEKEGNSLVSPDMGQLANWCHTQRQKYKKNQLSQEQINLLETIKFAWKFRT